MQNSAYILHDTEELVSPALIYYEDIIRANTKRIVEMAKDADRLWPHVKTHKTANIIQMQLDAGITRFKCATIAEAEMAAAAGGQHIILAYPLIGPNISRYLRLAAAYPRTDFYAIGDDYDSLAALAAEAGKTGKNIKVLIDVDVGMRRTGVAIEHLQSFYERAASLQGITLKGMHCYDGHIHDEDFKQRKTAVDAIDSQVLPIQKALQAKGLDCAIMVMGGTPTFPCRIEKSGCYFSPGTIFIGDWGYYTSFPDLAFTPGAALFTRVVSHPTAHSFTLDLGYKGIASDPAGVRGTIAGMEAAQPLFQSEEHWVFTLPEGMALPPIGSACYVLPTHICPTSALYPEIQIARNGTIMDAWQVNARNRKINY